MTLGTLSLTRSSRTYFAALKQASRAWRDINHRAIDRAIQSLYESKLVDIRELADGRTEMQLTERGKKKVLLMNIDAIKLPEPSRWDGKWRMVLFDIPEEKKRARDALRQKLTDIGFKELQKSVLVYPHACHDQLDFLIEYFELRRYVRTLEAINLDVGKHLEKKFGLK